MSAGETTALGDAALSRALSERVLRVARRLATSSDLNEILAVIIDALRDTLSADRASVFQYDPATNELFATQAHGLPRSLRLPADKGIIGDAARTRQIINIPDAYADPRFNRAVDVATGYHTRCLLTIPLIDYEGRLVGVAQVLNKALDRSGVFGPEDEVIAGYLADQAGVALKRASLQEAQRIKEKLEADLDVARRIQRAALPNSIPEIPGYDIAAHLQSADETAGDAYDVEQFDGPAGEPGAALFMADATGHGIGPALSVAQVHSMLRMGRRLGASPDVIAAHVNRQLCDDLPVGRFVTAFFGRLDAQRHEIVYVSAGQAPLLTVRAGEVGDQAAECRPSNAMPLGIDPDLNADDVTPIEMHPGDVFALLSDGYYEAGDPRTELFGVQRVIDALRGAMTGSAQDMIDALRLAVEQFTGGAPANDDRTAVIVRRLADHP